MSHTQYYDHFHVVTTKCIEETVSYIYCITKYMQNEIGTSEAAIDAKHFAVGQPTFDEFNDTCARYGTAGGWKASIGGVFAMQLLQIPLCNSALTSSICEVYPTPQAIINALGECESDKQRKDLLHRTVPPPPHSNRGVGPQLSARLCSLYHVD